MMVYVNLIIGKGRVRGREGGGVGKEVMGIVFGTQKQASMHAFGAPTVLSVHAVTRAVRALRVISNGRLRSASGGKNAPFAPRHFIRLRYDTSVAQPTTFKL